MGKHLKKFGFRLLVAGISIGEFKTVGPLESSIEVMEESVGGSLTNVKEPGRVSYPNVVCTRGVTDNRDAYDMYVSYEQGIVDANFPLTVQQLTRDGSILKTWTIKEAFPVRFKAGDWDAMSSEAVIEELEFAITGLRLT